MVERGHASVSPGVPQEPGPLTALVLEYQDLMKRLVPTAKTAADWGPLGALVAVEDFERVGTFLEVHNWPHYIEMLSRWASTIDSFETTVHRVAEIQNFVYFEIEERHRRGDATDVVNSMTVFRFNGNDKIDHLDVYLQSPR